MAGELANPPKLHRDLAHLVIDIQALAAQPIRCLQVPCPVFRECEPDQAQDPASIIAQPDKAIQAGLIGCACQIGVQTPKVGRIRQDELRQCRAPGIARALKDADALPAQVHSLPEGSASIHHVTYYPGFVKLCHRLCCPSQVVTPSLRLPLRASAPKGLGQAQRSEGSMRHKTRSFATLRIDVLPTNEQPRPTPHGS